ncbi:Similar to Uncharacterized protein C24H6.11c; acc. no. Q09764 [Pyronema omphalodes CBS 100304]|uniref:Similar to Uncharacterized protein C24H6.11c acc. no. Q09764 n=1 Tax=Pyronema omphalodes (strain CBS 100304) TaxID=1076935 RepID=U4LLF4_PYROM|nr:Similar to Uncharacterized protein C24H6.11c; acc. no. Q09764 [Pyronema omphalodes CBS 100304]
MTPHHDNLNPRPILSAARSSHSRDLFESARSSSYPRVSASPSHLSHLFRKDQLPVESPGESRGDYDHEGFDSGSECDPLVVRPRKRYGAIDYSIPEAAQEEEDDLESQRRYRRKSSARPRHGSTNRGRKWPKNGVGAILKLYDKPKWSSRDIWEKGIVQPVQYLPAVFLGLLLNILDGLSYGMILFPLGESMFSDLGPDGLSMFYVSCIVSQLVYSCGGSAFRGGVGSEMIEVVPFFHQMAYTILNEVGQDNPKSVLATTILSYAISSVLTGAVFFLLGYLKLGSLIGFFPRHILVGCIGGVGWFLMATGLEVCARLNGNLSYDLDTLALLFKPGTLILWTIPLALACVLILAQKKIKHPLFMPLYFLSIPIIFHVIVALVPSLDIHMLREKGWVFDAPQSGAPFWHFYTLYDFGAVDWNALLKTVPAMFALTFFGILHVPINVPALAVSSGMDNVDVDKELIAHGISNALSGCTGSIQNYLVYTNSILFIRAGADSRLAGLMLAAGTFGVMVAGPNIVGFIPVMIVGALIFLLGIELLREALVDTWGKLNKLEYLTICTIVVTMGAWDFVIGILIGVLLACVSLVVQTSRKSPIRATYSGSVARSTVRRHPTQQKFLREVGSQIQIVKLAGYMFFGTITSVETYIRSLDPTIRFVVLDLGRVTGIDFSAAEAFTRMQRVMAGMGVEMVLSGVTRGGDVGNALVNVGVWDVALVFETLNEALEFTENEFLKALYHEAAMDATPPPPSAVQLPKQLLAPPAIVGFEPSSPRRAWVRNAAETTMGSDEVAQTTKWATFKQPLPLILQTFQGTTDKNEDFWFSVCPVFRRVVFKQGQVVFERGDESTGFYLLEEGIFRAEYDLDQGRFTESIVAGTTCGELPFFSETNRTATVVAETDVVAWVMDRDGWETLKKDNTEAAMELLRISMKLTAERMHAITSYVLTSAG